MALRIVLKWVALFLLLVLLVSGLGSLVGEVELMILGVVFLAIRPSERVPAFDYQIAKRSSTW